jgi:hypothetical protein
VQGEGTVARVRVLIVILLLFSYITLVSAVKAAFPAAHCNKRVELSANSGPSAMILGFIHPNDPGSGGGGGGVHK